MMQYRNFQIYSAAEPVVETLLGQITQWSPSGSIGYQRPNGSLVELTRFRLSSMKIDDKQLAEWFGLEVGRLLVDICYSNLVIARERAEKRVLFYHRPAVVW